MSSYKTDQCRLNHRGREFHFVSYDGHAANPAKNIVGAPPMWFMMAAGRRHEVMAVRHGEGEEQRTRRLKAWLEEHVFKKGTKRAV